MSKELLAALDLDSERLLFAGAQVARSDGDLGAHKDPLAPLAARAPALARVVEQVEKVQKASGKAAATELLNLATLMAQVRGAQASPGAPAGELTPLPPAVPIESPLPVHELTSLVNALTNAEGASHRPRILKDAIDRGAFRDLRILPLCLSALSDSGIADVVQEELLPGLGEVIAAELETSLKLQGGRTIDARKLRALAAIRKAGVKPLVHEALEKGSSEVRTAALVALAGIDPAEAEPIAIRLLASDRSHEVRAAALEALGACATDGALNALLEGFAQADDGRLHNVAHRALARSAHPRATERLLALLTPELLALTPVKPPRSKSNAVLEAAKKAVEEHRTRVEALNGLLVLLGQRGDKLAVRALLGVLRNHKMDDVRKRTAVALVETGDGEAFDAILSALDQGRIDASFLEEFAWSGSGKAFELVLKMASGKLTSELADAMLPILTSRRDPRVAPLLIKLLDVIEGARDRSHLLEAIRDSGEASLAAPLQAWLTKNGKRIKPVERDALEELIAFLQPAPTPAGGQ